EIAISFNGDISEALIRTLSKLDQATTDNEYISIAQSFARKLIRTYYSMLMQRSQIWTTRLNEQAEVIVRYFQDKESIVHTLQQWIVEPPSDRAAVRNLFKREGQWTSEHFEAEARIS